MSARSVCSGTRPSRYHSRRAISAPPKRPEQLMRMPSAPRRMADCTARFIARRNATRRSSCWAIDSATRVASISGLRTSTILIATSEVVSLATCLRSFSMSAPFLPMTTPGRAEWMLMRAFLCGRSMTIFEIAACLRLLVSESRIFMSSCNSLPYSPLLEYQRESQVRLMPRRSPIGLIFCPMVKVSFLSGLGVGGGDFPHDDGDVRKRLLDASRPSARTRAEAFQHHVLAYPGLDDDEIVDVEIMVVLGVGDRRLERLLHLDRNPLSGEFEIGERG